MASGLQFAHVCLVGSSTCIDGEKTWPGSLSLTWYRASNQRQGQFVDVCVAAHKMLIVLQGGANKRGEG